MKYVSIPALRSFLGTKILRRFGSAKFVPPPFFSRRSANLQEGWRLSKICARQMGKGGEPNRGEFNSRQLIKNQSRTILSDPDHAERKTEIYDFRSVLNCISINRCTADSGSVSADFAFADCSAVSAGCSDSADYSDSGYS